MTKNDFLELLTKRVSEQQIISKEIFQKIIVKIEKDQNILETLIKMEQLGGKVNIIPYQNHFLFIDTFVKPIKERTSVCYNKEFRLTRKNFPPRSSAEEIALEIGANLIDENEYIELQKYFELDLNTSTWLFTPDNLLNHGIALFGDRKANRVFIYHNGAQSYYSNRSFRLKKDIYL